MELSQQPSLPGKNILITGASRGIGYETAAELARRGAHVILVSHVEERLQAAQARITTECGPNAARYYIADLSAQAEIHQAANAILKDYQQLDVLINNVGGWFNQFTKSVDGIEMTFALNHLSYFLLTGRLLALLKNTPNSRIINVSSDAHRQTKSIQFDDLQFEQRFRSFSAYAHSKLANVMFTYELANRLERSGVSVNALHPGLVKTELYRHFGVMAGLVKIMAKVFGKDEVEGAQTSIYLASSPDVATISGKYFADSQQRPSSPVSYNREQVSRLWNVSQEMTGFSYPD